MPRDLAPTEAFLLNETGTSDAAEGVNGEDIAVGAGTVPVETDFKIEDPVGIERCRGWVAPVGSGAPGYFKRAFGASDIFDVRGITSCAISMWAKRRSTADAGMNAFSLHNPLNANGQALWLILPHLTIGANPAPAFFMLDGLSAFNFEVIQATDTVSPVDEVWEYHAGGLDAVRNKIWNYWGRNTGERYYAERDGFAAGFGYTGAAGCEIGLGQYKADANPVAETRFDQVLWWNGFVLTVADLDYMWNNHVGRPLTEMIIPDPIFPGGGVNPVTQLRSFKNLAATRGLNPVSKALVAQPTAVFHIADIRETLRLIYGEEDE